MQEGSGDADQTYEVDVPCTKKRRLQTLDISSPTSCDIPEHNVGDESDLNPGQTGAVNGSGKKDCVVHVSEGTDRAVCEQDVGITEYISPHVGFNGIIKQRYSDFLVNEIRRDGTIARLTDTAIPEEELVYPEGDVLSDHDITLLTTLSNGDNITEPVMIKVASECKDVRTQIHKKIRLDFPKLESETLEDKGEKFIKVTYQKKSKGSRTSWPSSRGNYCCFVMYKENRDTMDAINYVSKLSRINGKSFTFAGTKDKRAKTSQDVTIYRTEAATLKKLNDKLNGVVLGNFRYVKEPLKLGALKGNHFSVVIRNVTGSDEQIETGMSSLQKIGFINYYGMQRFGTTSVPTHHIGRKILHSKWDEAIELILQPRSGDHGEIAKCRKVYQETKDPNAALKCLTHKNCLEKQLLNGLVRSKPNDLVGALSMMPRNSRMMYVHSYQSYIWNCVVSRRIQQFGLALLPGDLVIAENSNSSTDITSEAKVNVLEEKEISAYTIYDIVLPLPGYDITYPENVVKDWYKELLSVDGLEASNLKHKVKDYSLPGAYRKIVVKPSSVSWECIKYNLVSEPLCLSDYDKLQGLTLKYETEGIFKALKMEFSLPQSTYATMAIREIIKCDTSASYQSTLNVT